MTTRGIRCTNRRMYFCAVDLNSMAVSSDLHSKKLRFLEMATLLPPYSKKP